MGVGDGPRGPRVHLWNGSGCSGVRGRWGAGLRIDKPDSRRVVLIKHSEDNLDNMKPVQLRICQ